MEESRCTREPGKPGWLCHVSFLFSFFLPSPPALSHMLSCWRLDLASTAVVRVCSGKSKVQVGKCTQSTALQIHQQEARNSPTLSPPVSFFSSSPSSSLPYSRYFNLFHWHKTSPFWKSRALLLPHGQHGRGIRCSNYAPLIAWPGAAAKAAPSPPAHAL